MKKYTGIILALDLATTSGFAWGKPTSEPRFGSIRFGQPGGSRASCYREFRNWLEAWFGDAKPPDLIVFESPVAMMIGRGGTNADTVKKLVGLCEHLEEWCYDKVELREANLSQIRQHFIGISTPTSDEAKRLTVDRCMELGWKVRDDDEADACALWDYMRCILRPELGTSTTPLFTGR